MLFLPGDEFLYSGVYKVLVADLDSVLLRRHRWHLGITESSLIFLMRFSLFCPGDTSFFVPGVMCMLHDDFDILILSTLFRLQYRGCSCDRHVLAGIGRQCSAMYL